MGAKDGILWAQMGADARGNSLFTDIGMAGTVDETGGIGFCQLFLGAANYQEAAI